MQKDTLLRVAVDKDGNAIIHQGLVHPALFISQEQMARWVTAAVEPIPTLIESRQGIVIIAVMLEADSQFSVPKGVRPPSALPEDVLLTFTLINEAKIGYISSDAVLRADTFWFVQQRYDFVVGPRTYKVGEKAVGIFGCFTARDCRLHLETFKNRAKHRTTAILASPMPDILRAVHAAVTSARSKPIAQIVNR